MARLTPHTAAVEVIEVVLVCVTQKLLHTSSHRYRLQLRPGVHGGLQNVVAVGELELVLHADVEHFLDRAFEVAEVLIKLLTWVR